MLAKPQGFPRKLGGCAGLDPRLRSAVSAGVGDGERGLRRGLRAPGVARISHEWCPKLHLGEGKGVGSWVAGAKMPTERGNWAWMTGVEGNGDVKSDYRDSYPEQRREGWDV